MDMMKMMKQAADLKKNMKKKQNELSKKIIEFSENGVSVKCSCDLKIISINIEDELIESCDKDKIEKFILKSTQGAIEKAQKINNERDGLSYCRNEPSFLALNITIENLIAALNRLPGFRSKNVRKNQLIC